LGFLALALAFVPEHWTARGWIYLLPTLAMMGGGLAWMGRVRREAPDGIRLDRFLRGWTGICLFTALLAAIWTILWHARFQPQLLQAWLANVEQGLEAQGYSPGDAEEVLHRMRVTLTGPLGVFIGTVLWTVSGLVPGLVFSVFRRSPGPLSAPTQATESDRPTPWTSAWSSPPTTSTNPSPNWWSGSAA
jgi:hypothetical protein